MSEVRSYQAGVPAWVDLTTSDPAASRRFYGKLFGWEYATFSVGAHLAGGALAIPDQWHAGDRPNPRWLTYFAVDDADTAAASAGPLGGSVLFPPQDSPFGRFAALRDPQGATFNAIRLPSAPEGPAS